MLNEILNSSLTEEQVRIVVTQQFDLFARDAAKSTLTSDTLERLRSVGDAKDIHSLTPTDGFFELVRQAINDYETRARTPTANKVFFTEEEPDVKSETETITCSLLSREPGAYSQGAPLQGKVKNLRPIIREVAADDSNPGYRSVVQGFLYDNVVRFTCWARTNKRSNYRAVWFENFMEDYTWWFVLSGVKRVIYQGQGKDIVVTVNNNKWYGRPIDFFVQTEKLKVFSEKTLEEITLRLSVHERVIE